MFYDLPVLVHSHATCDASHFPASSHSDHEEFASTPTGIFEMYCESNT